MFVCSYPTEDGICGETFEGSDAGDKYADHLTFDHDAYTRVATIEADVESGVAE